MARGKDKRLIDLSKDTEQKPNRQRTPRQRIGRWASTRRVSQPQSSGSSGMKWHAMSGSTLPTKRCEQHGIKGQCGSSTKTKVRASQRIEMHSLVDQDNGSHLQRRDTLLRSPKRRMGRPACPVIGSTTVR